MDITEARSILTEIIEHDTPDAAEACQTVLAALDEIEPLHAVAVHAREYRRLTANGPYQHAGRRLDDALNVLGKDPGGTGWRAGDKHECPRYSRVHTATSKCADYAIEHGDRLYLGEREEQP